MELRFRGTFLVLLALGSWAVDQASAVTVVCTPYAQNTAPALITVSWDGKDPSGAVEDCSFPTALGGYRVSYTQEGETSPSIASTIADPGTQVLTLTSLISFTSYTIQVEALDGSNAVIPASISVAAIVSTDAAITGAVASFGFISSQQIVVQQLTFFENGFPFAVEASTLAAGAFPHRLKLTANAGSATSSDVVEFVQDGSSVFFGNVKASSDLAVAGSLTVQGTVNVGKDFLIVDPANARVSFGTSTSIDTSSGELQVGGIRSTGTLKLSSTVAPAIDFELFWDDADEPAIGPWLNVASSELRVAKVIGLDTIASTVADVPGPESVISFSDGTAAVPTVLVYPTSGLVAATSINISGSASFGSLSGLESVTFASASKTLTLSIDDAPALFVGPSGGSHLLLEPSSQSLSHVSTIAFDNSTAQRLVIGSTTLSASGATDSVLAVGSTLSVETGVGKVKIGDFITAIAASGSIDSSSLNAGQTVNAGLRVSVTNPLSASSPSTFLEHGRVQVAETSHLRPGALRVQDGGAAVVLCASANCTNPALRSSSGVLDVYALEEGSVSARFGTSRIETFVELRASSGLSVPDSEKLTASNIASTAFFPLQLESNYPTGIKVKVMGHEVMLVTDTGVAINGTLEVTRGIVSPSLTSAGPSLSLGSMGSVDFEIDYRTVGRASATGLEVPSGYNIFAPEGSAVVFGDMPLYADSMGNWRGATPVLRVNGSNAGAASLTVSGDFQVNNGSLVKGNMWVGGDLVLSSPEESGGRTTPTPIRGSDACDKGTLRWDDDAIYVCISTGSWKRSSLGTFG